MGLGGEGADDGLTEGDGIGVGEGVGTTIAGVELGAGEGIAAAAQLPRSASDTSPAASLAATVCQRIAPRLRDACTPIIARRSRG